MIDLNTAPELKSLQPKLEKVFDLAKKKIERIDAEYDEAKGSPVFTVEGKYTTRGWTEWTEGFRYGIAILHFDATGDETSSNRELQNKEACHQVSTDGVRRPRLLTTFPLRKL